MEFTKAEQRILSSRHEKWHKLLLWEGILMICASLGLVLYHHYQVDNVRQKFEKIEMDINQRIQPTTKMETMLKDMRLEGLGREKKYVLTIFELKTSVGSMLLFFTGIYLVGIYFMQRRFISLIRKLQKS